MTTPRSISALEIRHSDQSVTVALKRLASARRFTLRIRTASRDAVLTMPLKSNLDSARDFLQRHAAWISVRLDRLPKPVPFAPGSLIPYLGEDHLIVHNTSIRGTVQVEEMRSILGHTQKALVISGDLPHLNRRLHEYFKRQAKIAFDRCVQMHCAELGLAPRKVTIKDTTSRWGSCSSSGALNFSWRLIMAPPFVLNYLAAHEVAHLKHMNHSKRFWALTEKLCPDLKRAEAWLQAHGPGLYKFGQAVNSDNEIMS
jgi:predicted metal-dependent hydrolase